MGKLTRGQSTRSLSVAVALVAVDWCVAGCGDTSERGTSRVVDRSDAAMRGGLAGNEGDAGGEGGRAGSGGAGTGGSGGEAGPDPKDSGAAGKWGPDGATSDGAAPSPGDAGPSCLPPPTLPSTGPTCTDLPYNAASISYVLFIADATAPGGGHRISFAITNSVTVAGHTIVNQFGGLVGGGPHGVYGDALFDVDGVVNALGFHFEGCATPLAANHWELIAAVTRTSSLCGGCRPEAIERRYLVELSGTGSGKRYTFVADGPPEPCLAGADLLEFVQPG